MKEDYDKPIISEWWIRNNNEAQATFIVGENHGAEMQNRSINSVIEELLEICNENTEFSEHGKSLGVQELALEWKKNREGVKYMKIELRLSADQ